MAISESEIAQVRSATDIVALISETVALKKSGRRWTGLCPFHGEKTPSFSVNAEEGRYYCFGCRAGGSVFDFAASLWQTGATKGVAFLALRERLAGEQPNRGDRQRQQHVQQCRDRPGLDAASQGQQRGDAFRDDRQ